MGSRPKGEGTSVIPLTVSPCMCSWKWRHLAASTLMPPPPTQQS